MCEAKSPFLFAAFALCPCPLRRGAAWMRCWGGVRDAHPHGREGPTTSENFSYLGARLGWICWPGIDVHLENEGKTWPGLAGRFSWRCQHALEEPGALSWCCGPKPVAGGPQLSPPVHAGPAVEHLGTRLLASFLPARARQLYAFFRGDFSPS